MNGNNILIDTNIAIYLLDGDTSLAEILHQKRLALSFITQLELLGYPGITDKEERQIEYMLENCVVIDVNHIITSDKDFKKREELNLMIYEK
jgi:predicted nucleic acid-binding protein